MAGALDGITVVEFSSNLAAAYATMLLAEQGAEAIKIEPRGGDPSRGTSHFHALNRSKRSVCLDLATESGKSAACSLVRLADVVVSGWTLIQAVARGLDYESVRGINPSAIVLATPPFGFAGPEAGFDTCDELVAARAGITASQWARSGNPVALNFPAASYSSAVMGAMAATAALCARPRTAGQL